MGNITNEKLKKILTNLDKILVGSYAGQSLGKDDYKHACTSGPAGWYKQGGINLYWWTTKNGAVTFDNSRRFLEGCGMKPVWHGTLAAIDKFTAANLRPGDIGTLYTGVAEHQHGMMWTGSDWRSDTIQRHAACYSSSNQGEYAAVIWRHPDLQQPEWGDITNMNSNVGSVNFSGSGGGGDSGMVSTPPKYCYFGDSQSCVGNCIIPKTIASGLGISLNYFAMVSARADHYVSGTTLKQTSESNVSSLASLNNDGKKCENAFKYFTETDKHNIAFIMLGHNGCKGLQDMINKLRTLGFKTVLIKEWINPYAKYEGKPNPLQMDKWYEGISSDFDIDMINWETTESSYSDGLHLKTSEAERFAKDVVEKIKPILSQISAGLSGGSVAGTSGGSVAGPYYGIDQSRYTSGNGTFEGESWGEPIDGGKINPNKNIKFKGIEGVVVGTHLIQK